MAFNIIAKKFTPAEFENYCATIGKQSWVKHIVLHNTASPSLAQRPGGVLTAQHIKNLQTYYEGLGWSGGPHLFVDATGIWVFNPLNKKGVHSPSYNTNSWGIEMLGNYQIESFTTGLGAKVASNAQQAIAILAKTQGFANMDKLILHKEDTQTTHRTCPGKNVDKKKFIAAVNQLMKPAVPEKLEVIANGQVLKDAYVNEKSVCYVPLRALSDALGLHLVYNAAKKEIVVNKD